MLPVSAKDLIRFTPPGCDGEKPPVYLIEVPTYLTRPLLDRTLAERGLSPTPNAELRAAMEEGIRLLVEDRQRDELLALAAAYWDAADENPLNVPPEIARPYADVESQLLPSLPEYRRLVAARAYFFAMYPLVACECFLKGVENVAVDFRLGGGLVSRKTMEALDPAHAEAVGWRALTDTYLTKEQEKNSASPSPSPSSPATSTAGPSPKTAARGGNSSAKSTRKTRASA